MIKQCVSGLLVMLAGCTAVDTASGPRPADPDSTTDPTSDTAVAAQLAAIPPPATPGGTWTALANVPVPAAGFMLLLTDGTVIVSEISTNRWWRLTPDILGSYLNGTWSQIAAMPSGYAPLYFGAGVLPDGRVMIEGGEYISGSAVWSNRGAVYNPATNTWATVTAPAGWTSIGDASAAILADGTYIQSDCCSTRTALLNPTTMTWTATGTGKQGSRHDEESWTRLWDGTILTVDCNNTVNLLASEIYTPSTGRWTLGPNTANKTCDINPDGSGSHENGPQILRYDGTVLAVGGTGHNDVYDQTTKTWKAVVDSPLVGGRQLDSADGPGVLLPNGNVLLAMSPGIFQNGTHMLEWDGSAFTEVAAPPRAPSNSSYHQNFMLLPTGEVLLSDFSSDIEMYRPTVQTPADNAVPAITTLSSFTLARGSTFTLTGSRINGLSEAVAYGDDAQPATSYPIIRVTMTGNHHVFYCRTFNHSTRAIGPNVTGTTSFTVPTGAERGTAQLELIANGIASQPVSVTIM